MAAHQPLLEAINGVLALCDDAVAWTVPAPANRLCQQRLDGVRTALARDLRALSARITAGEKLWLGTWALTSAGKSTLFNALIGRRLVHSDNAADTMGHTFVRHTVAPGPEPVETTLHFADALGNPQGVQPDDVLARGDDECYAGIGQRHRDLANATRGGRADVQAEKLCVQTALLRFLEPSPNINEAQLAEVRRMTQLVDSPGPDAVGVSERVKQLSHEARNRAHVLLFVLNYTMMGVESERDMFRQLNDRPDGRELLANLQYNDARNKVFIVVNKAERLPPTAEEAQRQRVIENIQGHVGVRVHPARIFFVAARFDLLATLIRRRVNFATFSQEELHEILDDVFGLGAGHEYTAASLNIDDPVVARRCAAFEAMGKMALLRQTLAMFLRTNALRIILEGWVTEFRRIVRRARLGLEEIVADRRDQIAWLDAHLGVVQGHPRPRHGVISPLASDLATRMETYDANQIEGRQKFKREMETMFVELYSAYLAEMQTCNPLQEPLADLIVAGQDTTGTRFRREKDNAMGTANRVVGRLPRMTDDQAAAMVGRMLAL